MRICFVIAGLILLCTWLCGCSNEHDGEHVDAVYLYTPSQVVSCEAGICQITLAATVSWSATTGAEWIKATPATGDVGFTAVCIAYEANTTGSERTDSVIFSAGAHSAVFKLTQTE